MKFDKHNRIDHDLWKYVYLITYIKQTAKDSINDFDGKELYIHDELDSQSYDWLPRIETQELKNLDDGSDDEAEDNEETANKNGNKINKLQKYIEEIEAMVEKIGSVTKK